MRGDGTARPFRAEALTVEAVPEAASGRKLKPLVIGGTLALVIVSAAAVWWWRGRGEQQPATSQAPNQAANQVAAAPASPPGMVYVPGGEFLMGNDTGDEYERPAHTVTVKPFFIDVYEVTGEEYQKFVAATGHRAPPGWIDGHYPSDATRQPVVGVDWDDATAYAAWAGKRLPTEEEWEFAARGTDGRRYPWGNEWRPGLANDDSAARKGLAEVGTYPDGKSPFGLLDMAGNAWEWTASILAPYPGGHLPEQEPGDFRIIRGGGWKSTRAEASATYRMGWPARGGEAYNGSSFRCAKDAMTQTPSNSADARK